MPDPTNPPDHSVVETDAHHERHRGLCHTHNRELPSRRGVNDTDHLTQQPDATSGLDGEYPDAPYGLLVRTAAYSGLRAAELAGLRIRDVNLLRQEIRVARTLQRRNGTWHAGTPKSAAVPAPSRFCMRR